MAEIVTLDENDLLEQAYQRFPILRKHQFSIRRGTGPKYAEFYPAWEEDNPQPGRHLIELRPQSQTYRTHHGQEDLSGMVAGEMLHLLGWIDPRSGEPVDPIFRRMKEELSASRTDIQQLMDKQAHELDQDPRSHKQYLDQSRLDAYIRGYLLDQWPSSHFTKEQRDIFRRMNNYLRQK